MYEITIPTKRPIELLAIGDIHAGHVDCDYRALGRVRKYLSRSKYRRWVGMGDYNETVCPTASPPGAIWTQDMDPGEQIDWQTGYWTGVEPELLIKGNHEDRIYKLTGIRPSIWLDESLSICECANTSADQSIGGGSEWGITMKQCAQQHPHLGRFGPKTWILENKSTGRLATGPGSNQNYLSREIMKIVFTN